MHAYPQKHTPQLLRWIPCLKSTVGFRYLTGALRRECDLNNVTSLNTKPNKRQIVNRKAFLHAWQAFPWREMFGLEKGVVPGCVTYYAGAHFVVSRAVILRRPRDWYVKLLEHVQRYILRGDVIEGFKGSGNGAMGHVLERVWHMVFSSTEGPHAPPRVEVAPYDARPCSDYFRASCCESGEGVG